MKRNSIYYDKVNSMLEDEETTTCFGLCKKYVKLNTNQAENRVA